MTRRLLFLLLAVLLLPLVACGEDETPLASGDPAGEAPPATDDPEAPVSGGGTEEPGEPGDPWDEFPTDQAREDARAYLGMYEHDLPDEVRVARRGDEHFVLTDDYRLGRVTVELDDTDSSGYRVTSLVVELPDGPETFELEPG